MAQVNTNRHERVLASWAILQMAGSGKVINYARSKLLCQPVDFVCWPVVGPGEAKVALS